MIPNMVYDILKQGAIIILPALSVLYSRLAAIWGWPFAEEVPATISAVTLCIGAVLNVSSANYDPGKDREGETDETDEPDE